MAIHILLNGIQLHSVAVTITNKIVQIKSYGHCAVHT